MLKCIECGAVATEFETGWSALHVIDPDEGGEPLLVIYCAECLTREFGGLWHWLTDSPASELS